MLFAEYAMLFRANTAAGLANSRVKSMFSISPWIQLGLWRFVPFSSFTLEARLTVYDVLGKTLLEKVADVTNNAKQLASGALGGNIPISNKDGNADFNDEAGIAAADIDVVRVSKSQPVCCAFHC